MNNSYIYNQCADIDECELGDACGADSLCTNTEGGFSCECPPGFSGDAKIACLDIDECTSTKDICGRNANCANLPGTFRCECPSGFQGDPLVICEGDLGFSFLKAIIYSLISYKERLGYKMSTSNVRLISISNHKIYI